MTPTRRPWLLASLLPLLALRMLLPAGYMPVLDGELRLVPCPAGMYQPAAHEPVHHDGHGEHHGEHQHDSGQHPAPVSSGKCPFASALFKAAAPPFIIVAATSSAIAIHAPPAAALPPATLGPPRFTAARAPPTLS